MRARVLLVVTMVLAAMAVGPPAAQANHPVLVEGNCDSPVPFTTIVTAGTCGDFDGDGRIGTAEDTDGADRVFGTIGAALGLGAGAAAGTGINQNGRIIIVASGRFPEQLTITGVPDGGTIGNVTIEAAPGVLADIDAVLQGDPAGGNDARQSGVGIIIDSPDTTIVTLRNLVVRNFKAGIGAVGESRVNLDDVRLENNRDYGIFVDGTARVAITDSEINATGFRVGSAVDNTPDPGTGVIFLGTSQGLIDSTTVTGSFAAGIHEVTGGVVKRSHLRLFDNMPNFQSG